MTEFQASAKGHATAYGATMSEARDAFFAVNPGARKCFIIEGRRTEDHTFEVSYSRAAWPRSAKDVTRKTVLP